MKKLKPEDIIWLHRAVIEHTSILIKKTNHLTKHLHNTEKHEKMLLKLSTVTDLAFGSFHGREYYEGVFDKASFILFTIIKNHYFVDGNKRTALASTQYFLFINNYNLNIKNFDVIPFLEEIASGGNDIQKYFKKISKTLEENSTLK